MKVDEKTREYLINNLKVSCDSIKILYHDFIEEIKEAKSVEEIMRCKKEFLISFIDYNFPMTAETCYFCVYDYHCSTCPYSKEHGQCDEDESSSWNQINDMKRKFMDKIDEEYFYDEETYPGVVNEK